jgi:hypothetical protein
MGTVETKNRSFQIPQTGPQTGWAGAGKAHTTAIIAASKTEKHGNFFNGHG